MLSSNWYVGINIALIIIGWIIVVWILRHYRIGKKAMPPKSRLPPPCGFGDEHYYWTDSGWPCPYCASRKHTAFKSAELAKNAKVIAAEICKLQKEKKTMNYPCREKYIDEAMGGPLFIFGTRPDGTVDIANGKGDQFEGVPLDKANKIVAAHAEFMKVVYAELAMK